MSLSFFKSSLTLVLSAAVLAGCSKQEPAQPQEQPSASSVPAAPETLAGVVDRSHAGELMPAINVVDPVGKTLNTAALSGQPVLLNLWATWCAPCIKEMPMLDALAGEYQGRLRVITVSQDLQGKKLVPPFFAKEKFKHLQPWLDPDTKLSTKFGDGVLPTTVLYDSSGSEVARVVGGYDWSSPEARALVDEAVDPGD